MAETRQQSVEPVADDVRESRGDTYSQDTDSEVRSEESRRFCPLAACDIYSTKRSIVMTVSVCP